MSHSRPHFLPLLALLAALALVRASGLHRQLRLATLQDHRGALRGSVAGHPMAAAPLAHVLGCAGAVALSR